MVSSSWKNSTKMVSIKRASRSDLPAIVHLMQQSGKMIIEPCHLNNRDIALQARADDGSLVGFLWCGLMCGGKYGYIDKFAVDKEYQGTGLGQLLSLSMLKEISKRGVRRVIGCIKTDEHHEPCAMNALKVAMAADKEPYTFIHMDVENSIQEIKSLEAR